MAGDSVRLTFECLGARPEPYAAVPNLLLTLRITETSGVRVGGIMLRCQIRIEPTRRDYTDADAMRLHDLFGEKSRWPVSLKPMQFATVSAMVPGFTGHTEVDVPISCGYDLEVAWTKYFDGLDDGAIPLLLLFSGTVFTVWNGQMQVRQVPWSSEVAYPLPVRVWRELIDQHFPDSSWIRLRRDTMDALRGYKSTHALTTWDATVHALLDHVSERQP